MKIVFLKWHYAYMHMVFGGIRRLSKQTGYIGPVGHQIKNSYCAYIANQSGGLPLTLVAFP
jgi:hypothetical protein